MPTCATCHKPAPSPWYDPAGRYICEDCLVANYDYDDDHAEWIPTS